MQGGRGIWLITFEFSNIKIVCFNKILHLIFVQINLHCLKQYPLFKGSIITVMFCSYLNLNHTCCFLHTGRLHQKVIKLT